MGLPELAFGSQWYSVRVIWTLPFLPGSWTSPSGYTEPCGSASFRVVWMRMDNRWPVTFADFEPTD
jgi:hypothetical protein